MDRAAVHAFRSQLEKLPFTNLKVELHKDVNELSIDGSFRMPIFFRLLPFSTSSDVRFLVNFSLNYIRLKNN